jgi:protein arginine kinase activator
MNKCHHCGQPATIHVTDIVNKQKREQHLCEACAKAHDLLPDGPAAELNLTALVQLIMGQPPPTAGLACPQCGLTYTAFRADGRLGCAADYDAFRPDLEPLLDRIHRATRHAGKVPKAEGRRAAVAGLREALAAAVAVEDYETAARLRDQLRRKEGADEPG